MEHSLNHIKPFPVPQQASLTQTLSLSSHFITLIMNSILYLWRRRRSWRPACSQRWRTEEARYESLLSLLTLHLSSRTLCRLWCSHLDTHTYTHIHNDELHCCVSFFFFWPNFSYYQISLGNCFANIYLQLAGYFYFFLVKTVYNEV